MGLVCISAQLDRIVEDQFGIEKKSLVGGSFTYDYFG